MSNEQDSAWDASNLRAMIDKRGVRMRWLAERCSRSQGTLTNWTRGRTQPNVTDLGELAKALRCKVIQLLPRGGMMSEKRAPKNTAREASEPGGAMAFLAELRLGGSSAAIERQEKRGQGSFVESDTLPSDMRDDARRILTGAGVVFGADVPDDDLFVFVTLPDGWTKVGTGHSMWSKLTDEQGRERASIFYRAAFYDRSAFLRLCTRFTIEQDYDRSENEKVAVFHVKDGGEVVHTTDPIPEGEKRWEAGDTARKVAQAWLDERRPEWRDPSAYWNDA